MCGAIPPLPQYAFMAWCLVKSRDIWRHWSGAFSANGYSEVLSDWILRHVTTLRMRTEVVLETLVCSPFNHSTRLRTWSNFTLWRHVTEFCCMHLSHVVRYDDVDLQQEYSCICAYETRQTSQMRAKHAVNKIYAQKYSSSLGQAVRVALVHCYATVCVYVTTFVASRVTRTPRATSQANETSVSED
jgi:hypothetical protein